MSTFLNVAEPVKFETLRQIYKLDESAEFLLGQVLLRDLQLERVARDNERTVEALNRSLSDSRNKIGELEAQVKTLNIVTTADQVAKPRP